MLDLHPRYLTDEQGRRIAVMLDLAEFERLVSELEGRADARSEAAPGEVDRSPLTPEQIAEALSFAGIGEDTQPLIDGQPVSEYPDLYLYGPEGVITTRKTNLRGSQV
jgi:hypothetical protein